jgi:hypothetical protein
MRNTALERAMRHRDLTQTELAELINDFIENLTGKRGMVLDRTVRMWLSGKVRWPQEVRRLALEAVFGCGVIELGFIPRRRTPAAHHASQEDPVHRRRFITAASGTVLATAAATPRRVGSADIERLQAKFAALVANGQRHGGRTGIEAQATALADEALALQGRGNASQRVRKNLYACAASFTASAMWAATDGRRFDAAQRHFERASGFATMSADSAIQFRVWSYAGRLYRYLGRPTDALAANDVARHLPITRRDPVFASLGHARHAAIHGLTGNATAVKRTIGHAHEALDRADSGAQRPVWLTAFYDHAAIEALALPAHLSLGDYEQAEAHGHRSLTLLRSDSPRIRAINTGRLAHAQLGQYDLELAVTTAMSVPADMATRHPRVISTLNDFGTKLNTIAPASHHTRTWNDYAHSLRV